MINKQVNVNVLDEVADIAVVKEYREYADVYVFDLYKTIEVDEVEQLECLATDRCELKADAPFILTSAEIDLLKGVVSE